MAASKFQTVTRAPSAPMSILVQWAVSMHAFRRNRVPATKKVVAAALCNSGYSYRDVAKMVGGISYVAARDAYFTLLTSLPKEQKKSRKTVAIDGSDVNLGGRVYHLWLARDVESGEIMTFQASPDASSDDGARFLAAVAAQCTNTPFVRLGEGSNSPRGLANLDLYFQTAGNQSIIERLGRLLRASAG
jgi:transposase-like protein